MDWIIKKYINMLAPRLDRFKWVHSELANFRCPYCGDSKRDKKKARGYLFTKNDKVSFSCHNCGFGTSFRFFLKDQDPFLYQEHRLEDMKERFGERPQEVEVDFTTSYRPTRSIDELSALKKVSQLDTSHPARLYCDNRLLDSTQFYYAPNFPQWVSSTFEELDAWSKSTKHPRLIIPVIQNGNLLGMQARAFGNEKPKYCTLKLTEEDFLFGMDRVNNKLSHYVVEGPIDSLMIDNALAIMSSALTKYNHENAVYVFDNQPRNQEIVDLLEAAIAKGLSVVIWPLDFEPKDLNEARCKGVSKEQLQSIMKARTYKGLAAKLEFMRWKRI